VKGRHTWKKADMSGDCWKAEDSVMYFIYAPVITVSLVGNGNRPKLLAILPQLPFRAVFSFIAIKARFWGECFVVFE